ncbi:hypothetical protein J3S85_36380 [Streptomyces lavenduligriseus]|nr:hypothetical protein J3S85_36380 [Streptomyces lavenduligriseus]
MALTLFSRRPAPAPAAAPVEPEPWFETGETWTPEGVTVVERYWTQVHAVVLVYTAAQGYRHSVACLGCHYQETQYKVRYSSLLTLEQAAELANAHAAQCRAVPREIPARPDEPAARELLRAAVRGMRKRDYGAFCFSDLDTQRLVLQRTNDWIVDELGRMADEEPDVLKASVSEYGTTFYIQELPGR